MRVQRTESLIKMFLRFDPVALQLKENVTDAVLGKCVLICYSLIFRLNSSKE